jgi:AAA+ superfamily predicted ATPase
MEPWGSHLCTGPLQRIAAAPAVHVVLISYLHQHLAGVVVLAATNRADVLDAALMRPGRFDVQLHVPLPDTASRQAIMEVHTRAMPLHTTVDLKVPLVHPCKCKKMPM